MFPLLKYNTLYVPCKALSEHFEANLAPHRTVCYNVVEGVCTERRFFVFGKRLKKLRELVLVLKLCTVIISGYSTLSQVCIFPLSACFFARTVMPCYA